MNRRGFNRAALALALCVSVTACDFGVTNPGLISDNALNSEAAMGPVVAGMQSAFARELDRFAYHTGIAAHEITHNGVFEPEQFQARGEIEPRHVNGLWGGMHQARWVAESGIQRLTAEVGAPFTASALAVEAHLWAGFANRVLGENMCQAVIDGGAPQGHTLHFERAESWFTDAIALADAQDDAELAAVGYGGRAQVRLALENWAGAAADAAMVPTSASWLALYHPTGNDDERNWLHNQSHNRDYFSVIDSWAEDYHDGAEDPRVPWTDLTRPGADGVIGMIRQDKFTSPDAPIDVMTGDEMRLIEAEVALRLDDDVDAALGFINDLRADAGVDPVSAANVDEAWEMLRQERNIVLWIEARYLWDLRRFNDPFLSGRDSCIPIGETEANTNPNIS